MWGWWIAENMKLFGKSIYPQKYKNFTHMEIVCFSKIISSATLRNSCSFIFFQNEGVKMLHCPWNSPDLSLIENLWSFGKQRLIKTDCTTMERLLRAVIQIWYHNEELGNMCLKLVEFMPKRAQMLIKNRGVHIKYWYFRTVMQRVLQKKT